MQHDPLWLNDEAVLVEDSSTTDPLQLALNWPGLSQSELQAFQNSHSLLMRSGRRPGVRLSQRDDGISLIIPLEGDEHPLQEGILPSSDDIAAFSRQLLELMLQLQVLDGLSWRLRPSLLSWSPGRRQIGLLSLHPAKHQAAPWDAPELTQDILSEEEQAQAAVYCAGKIISWVCGDLLPSDCRDLVAEMTAPAAAQRPDLSLCLMAFDLIAAGRAGDIHALLENRHTPFLRPPQLCGRSKEMAQLQRLLESAQRGSRIICLISAESGTGKTRLVEEFGIRAQETALYASGKGEQYQHDQALLLLSQCLTGLASQVVGRGPEESRQLRLRLHEALGREAGVIAAAFPSLGDLLDLSRQPSAIPLSEGQRRLHLLSARALDALCGGELPVLFIDDIQWADAESLAVIEHLLSAPHVGGLLIIAAVRESSEAEFSHSLNPMLHAARTAGNRVEQIKLQALASADSTVLISSILRGPITKLSQLQRLVESKCQGNPFQTQQFLRAAIDRGDIRAELNGWTWEQNLENAAAADNVAVLVAARIRRLPADLHQLLHAAAILGYEFDAGLLQDLTDLAPTRTQALLLDAETAGLLIRKGGRWRFFHDRVQQAAIGLRDEDQSCLIHLKCAKTLGHLGAAPAEILAHLQVALPLLDKAARNDFAELALRCCRASLAAGALRTALKQCRAGRAALRQGDASQATAFQLLAADCQLSFLNSDHESAELLALEALPLAPGYQERADIRLVQISWRTFAARYEEAIAIAVDALNELGIELPPRGDDKLSRQLVEEALAHPASQHLEQLPLMEDARLRCILQLMASLGPPTYRYRQSLWAVLVPRAVKLILDHGWAPQGAYMFPAFGGLCTHYNLGFAPARNFGEAAGQLVARDGDSSISSIYHLMNGSSVSHWIHSRELTLEEYRASRRDGLASGNLQYAAYAYGHALYTELLSGHPLAQVAADANEWLIFGKSARNLWLSDLCSAVLACVDSLRLRAPCDPSGILLNDIASRGNRQVLCLLHLFRAISSLHQNRDEEARLDWLAAAGLLDTISTQGLLAAAEHHFIGLVLDGRRGRGPNAPELHRLRQQAEACPSIWKPRLQLVLAFTETGYAAAASYSEAAASAASPADAALAWSCARQFWLRLKEEGYAAAAAKAAESELTRWGASVAESVPVPSPNDRSDTLLSALSSGSSLEAATTLLQIACQASGSQEAELLLKDGWHLHLYNDQISPAPQESSFSIRRCLSYAADAGSIDDNGDFLISLDSGELKAAIRLVQPSQPPSGISRLLNIPLLILTRCRQLEKMRQLQKAAEESAAEHSSFLSLLCHEIRTPLNAILGSLDLLQQPGSEVPRLISSSCRSLLRLSDCITHFSGLQDGSLRPRLHPVHPLELIKEAISQAEDLIFIAGQNHSIHSQIDLPEVILCDARLLVAALQQLLANACQHGGGGIDLTAKHHRGQSEISIRDHGKGFPDSLLKVDLTAVMHSRASSLHRSGGLGIGLAVSAQCASLLGGSLQLRNCPDGGAEVILRLPLPEPLLRDSRSALPPARSRCVLVVEDNRSNQLVARRCLEALGWEVDVAADGAEALKCFDPFRHCLIFMDVLMPVMDGIEATRCLRLRHDTLQTPIIALTANATTHDREACLSAGMDEFLVKPVSKTVFSDCLARHFRDESP